MAFEVLQNGGAQHAFALAVDEDDATPGLFGILLQGLVENAQLTGENVGRGEAGRGVEDGGGVQIDFDDGVAIERCGAGHGSAGWHDLLGRSSGRDGRDATRCRA